MLCTFYAYCQALISKVDFHGAEEDDPEDASLSNFYIEIENSLGLEVQVNEQLNKAPSSPKPTKGLIEKLDSRHGTSTTPSSWITLPSSASHQLRLPSNLSAPKLGQNDLHLPSKRLVNIKVDKAWAPCAVNVDRVGISRYSLGTKCVRLHLTYFDLSCGRAQKLASIGSKSGGGGSKEPDAAPISSRDYTMQYNLFFGKFNACIFEVQLLDSQREPLSQPQRKTVRRPGATEEKGTAPQRKNGSKKVVVGNPDPYLDIEMDVDFTVQNVNTDVVRIRVFQCRADAGGGMGGILGDIAGAIENIGTNKPFSVLEVPLKRLLPNRTSKSGIGKAQTFVVSRATKKDEPVMVGDDDAETLGSLTMDARKSSFEFMSKHMSTIGQSSTQADHHVAKKNEDSSVAEFAPTSDFVCEVRIRSGRKVLEVRSGVKVLNHCAMNIELEFKDAAATAAGPANRKTLCPGSELCVPLHLLKDSGSIALRPVKRQRSVDANGGRDCFAFSKAQSLVVFLASATHREYRFYVNSNPTSDRAVPDLSIALSIETDVYGQKFVMLSPTFQLVNLVPLPISLRTCLSGPYRSVATDIANNDVAASAADIDGDGEHVGAKIAVDEDDGASETDGDHEVEMHSISPPRSLLPTETVKLHNVARALGLSLQVSLTLGSQLRTGVWSRPTLLMKQPVQKKRNARSDVPTIEESQSESRRRVETASTSDVEVLRLELPPDPRQKYALDDADGIVTYQTRCVFDVDVSTGLTDSGEDDEHRELQQSGKSSFQLQPQLALILEVTGDMCTNTWSAKLFSEYIVLNYSPFSVIMSEVPELSDDKEIEAVKAGRTSDGFSCGVNLSVPIPDLLTTSGAGNASESCEYFGAAVDFSLFSFVDKGDPTYHALKKYKKSVRRNQEKAGEVALKFFASDADRARHPESSQYSSAWSPLFSIDRTNVPGSLSLDVSRAIDQEANELEGSRSAIIGEGVDNDETNSTMLTKEIPLKEVHSDRISHLKSLEMGVGVFAGPGAFFRTKVVNIFPRFHLFNHTSVSLAVKPHIVDSAQSESENVVVIPPGVTMPFHFPLLGLDSLDVTSTDEKSKSSSKTDASAEMPIRVCAVHDRSQSAENSNLRRATAWSAPFGIVELQNFVLSLRKSTLRSLFQRCANVQTPPSDQDPIT